MQRAAVASLVAVAVVGAAGQVQAQVSQSVSFNVGYYALRAEDARPAGDVLVENLSFLAFDISEINGATAGADWLVGIGDYVDLGVGIGYYKRTVPSVYLSFVNSDGSEIAQDMKLRVTPLSVTARFMPLGRRAGVVPYVGAGLAAYRWRYSETGEFVDFTDNTIFRASYVDEGTKTGPVYLGGIVVPIGDVFAVGGEFRYQKATADLDPAVGFFGDQIDLGGYVSQFTFQIRF